MAQGGRRSRSGRKPTPLVQRLCACGAAFLVKPWSRVKSCSWACGIAATAAKNRVDRPVTRCDGCQVVFVRTRQQRFCGVACANRSLAVARQHQCSACGQNFAKKGGGRSGRFCSRHCAEIFRSNIRRQRRDQAVEARTGPCAVCARVFVRRSVPSALLCSDECRQVQKDQQKADRLVCRCSKCGEQFVAPKVRRHRCERCRAAAVEAARKRHARAVRHLRKHRHRARHYGVDFERGVTATKVFERDNWTCQLCGCRTPKRLKGSNEKRAPTLDHIVPMSKGGGHTWVNVQCACWECNIAKGASTMGQLWLGLSQAAEVLH